MAPGRIHTDDERAELLRRAEFLWKRGEGTVREIAKRLDISSATLFRWRSLVDQSEREDAIPVHRKRHPNDWATNAIAVLTSADAPAATKFERLEATLKFACWLRWPADIVFQTTALPVFLLAYVRGTSSAKSMVEVEPALQKLFLESLSLDELYGALTLQIDIPGFDILGFDNKPFYDHDLLAWVVQFFLWYRAPSLDRRGAASLGKALHAIRRGGFKYSWNTTRPTFRKLWKLSAAAAPFYYVESFHSPLHWILDPSASDFVESIQEILAQPEEVRRYFQRSAWVIKKVHSRRAEQRIQFPIIPPSVRPEPVPEVALDPKIETLMRDYKSGEDR